MSTPEKQYKAINPLKYFKDYLIHNIRPDGRELQKFRPIALNVNSISTSDGSSIIKLGNTTIVCGIKAELCLPKCEQPNSGFVVANVDLSPLCSSQFRPGPPGEQAQVISRFVNDIIADAKCVNLNDLCICSDKLVWVLYCDIICLDYDGAVSDAALLALITALKTVTLPEVDFDANLNEVKRVYLNKRKKLKINSIPVAISYVIFDGEYVLADPTAEEESLCNGSITVVIVDDRVSSVHKPGGTPISNEKLDACIVETKKQAKYILNLIHTVIGEDNNSRNSL